MPLRPVPGDAPPDDLSALVAVLAILATSSNGDPGRTERPGPEGAYYPRSQWGSPARMVRKTHPHGPGGWRASAFPG
jgi:hypothetical protein